ncbi:MAG: chalcone isomerase family protein [Deltaproteobacteria bacterium]|nr:chalcone isomerase family protein [Deltaproteobacteria bacterium]
MKRGLWHVVRIAVAGACLLLARGSADAQSIKEPSSGVKFDVSKSVLGRPATCIGVGIRKAFGLVKVYAAGLYVDDATGKASFQKLLEGAGGNLDSLRHSPQLYSWLIQQDFGKSMEWVFTRDLEKGKMTKVIKESLERELGDLSAPDLKEHADKFLAAVDVPLKKWQRMVIVQRPGFELVAVLDGKTIVSVTNKKIAQANWRIYLGKHPVQGDLKKNLVANIENLK